MERLWVIGAFFVGDWALQNNFVAQNKGKEFIIMLAHCIIVTFCICLALQMISRQAQLWEILFLLIGHGVSDFLKSTFYRDKRDIWQLYADQAWHIIQCFIVYHV